MAGGHIQASYDAEARVWWAESEDLPGLVSEAPTLNELFDRLAAVTPELLDVNGGPQDCSFVVDLRVCFQLPFKGVKPIADFYSAEDQMSDSPAADLTLLARQQRQILAELGSLRDDMAVLTAVAMRQDGTLAALLTEVRAMHAQHSRLTNRVRDLESQA